MPYKTALLGLLFTSSIITSACASTINKIMIEGNVKVPTAKLLKIVQPYIGSPLDAQHSDAAAKEIETYYHKNNYALAHASVQKIDEADQSIIIHVGKYPDFNARSIEEMNRREIVPGMINKIFFNGNEKISTQRLMTLVQPFLGVEKNQKNLDELVKNIQNYYRSHRYELVYAEIANIDDNGTVTVNIKKYPSFKERYTREGEK